MKKKVAALARLARSFVAFVASAVLARVGRRLEGFAAALDTRGEVRVPREILLALRVGSLGFAALALARALVEPGVWPRLVYVVAALFWARLGLRTCGREEGR